MSKLNQGLAAILVVLIALVWVFESPFEKSGYEITESKSMPLFPGFDESRAAKIEIKKGDGELAVLKKDASGMWVVDNHFGYMADQGRVVGDPTQPLDKRRSLLADVSKMRNTDLVDPDPVDFDKPYNLGAMKGTEVRISDAAGAMLAEFVQGKIEGDFKDPDFQRRFSKMPSYVRVLPGKEVYLVTQFPPVASKGEDWIQKGLFAFSGAKVQEIHLSGTLVGGEVQIKKEGEEWNLMQPEACKAKKEVVDAMTRSMASSSFRELVGMLDDPAKYELASPQLKVTMKLEGGEEQVLWVGKQLEDKSYFLSKGEKDKFVYLVTSYTVDALKKTAADLKDVPPPPPVTPENPNAQEVPPKEDPAKPQ